jgi:putative membrane protein
MKNNIQHASLQNGLLGLLAFLHVCGVILSVLIDVETISKLTPYFLIFAIVSVLYVTGAFRSKSTSILLGLIGIFGLIAESIGVKTGVLFGSYSYGTVLGISVLAVPLLVGVLWIFVSWLGLAIAQMTNAWVGVVFAVVWIVLYDVFLEPFAVATGMWSWDSGTIPLRNYFTWFVLSLLFIGILKYKKAVVRNPKIIFYVATLHVCYFFVITLVAKVQ